MLVPHPVCAPRSRRASRNPARRPPRSDPQSIEPGTSLSERVGARLRIARLLAFSLSWSNLYPRRARVTAVEQPPPAAYWGLAAPGMIGFVERAEARANKIVSRARDRIPNDVPIAAVVTSRPVKPALVRQITDGHHDLVVVGHRGHDARWSAMRRSVSDHVLRHTAVPVVIIRAESSRRDESPDFDLADYAPAPRQPTSRVEPQTPLGSAANPWVEARGDGRAGVWLAVIGSCPSPAAAARLRMVIDDLIPPDPRASVRDPHPGARAAHQPCAARPPGASAPWPSHAPGPAAQRASSVDPSTVVWNSCANPAAPAPPTRLSRSSYCSTLPASSRMNSTHRLTPRVINRRRLHAIHACKIRCTNREPSLRPRRLNGYEKPRISGAFLMGTAGLEPATSRV